MTEARKKYFENLRDILQDQNFSRNNLKVTLGEIQIVLSFKGGLLNDELRVLAQFLCATNLAHAINLEIVKCMIPRGPVSEDILDKFLVVILSRKKTPRHLKFSKLLLQWLLSVLDFGFAQLESFQDYYHLFFPLLGYKELNSYACKMIYKLTLPIDVDEIAIKQVMKYYEDNENNAKRIYMDTLLKYFDTYKPNYIDPGMIHDNINIDEFFENLPQDSSRIFALVHGAPVKQCVALVPIVGLQDIIMHEEVQMNTSQVKMNRLIPAITYSFPLNGNVSILSYESIKELGHNVLRVAIPDQILSLLYNDVGFFKLMTCDETDQKRFSHRLYDTLKQIFWEKRNSFCIEETENFLEQVFSLCNFMQQGIALCTNFVGEFLLTWSGLDYRSQILHLIEWAVVDSYSELSSILRSVHMLFVTSDIIMKSQIVSTLSNLVVNMAKTFHRVKTGIDQPFMKSHIPAWTSDPMSMFHETIQFISDLIQIGLCLEPDSTAFLDVVVTFYESVSYYQEIFFIPDLTIAPKGVVYRCLTSRNIIFLDRIAGLLLNYLEQCQRLEAEGLHLNFSEQLQYCDFYVKDILNSVFHGEALSRAEDGIIFRLLTPLMLKNITCFCPNNPNELFDLHNHLSIVTVLTTAREVTGRNMLPEEELRNQESRYNILQLYASKVAKLVDHIHSNQYPLGLK